MLRIYLLVAAFIAPCIAKFKIPEHHTTSTSTSTTNPPTMPTESSCPVPITPNPNPTTTCPCDLEDLKCIGDVLAAHSTCNNHLMWDFVPNQFTMYNVVIEIPFLNVTEINKYITFTNLDKCVVSAFLVVDERKTCLLALDCQDVVMEAVSGIIVHKSLELDEYYSYNIQANISLLRMTANMPHHDNLDLCSAYVYSDVTISLPTIQAHDKSTQKYVDSIQELIATKQDIITGELFNYHGGPGKDLGSTIFREVVNSKICNFDCNASTA